jgi:hypothetical protein
MRKDFQIALILALAALPAGLAVSEALEYFPFLKEHSGTAFLVSSAVTFILLGLAAVLAIRGEREAERGGAKKTHDSLGRHDYIGNFVFMICSMVFFAKWRV